MKQFALVCACGREELHGTFPPIGNVQTCVTARSIRGRCREPGAYCKFDVVEREVEVDDVAALRLGLRAERVIA